MLTTFAGSRLFGVSYGEGTPSVLALHGWRRDHHDFDQVLAGGEIPAVALDLPGFGSAPPPEVAWGSPEYAEAVAQIFGEVADRVVVIGHSFGGRVAVELAAAHPDRVAGLVLTGVPLYRPAGARAKPRLDFRLAKALAARGLVGEARVEAMRKRYGSADYRAAEGVMRDVLVKVLAEDYTAALSAISCPVELVWGDDDTAAPLEVAERIRDALPGGANLVVCPGAGHLTPLSVPGELRAALSRLLP